VKITSGQKCIGGDEIIENNMGLTEVKVAFDGAPVGDGGDGWWPHTTETLPSHRSTMMEKAGLNGATDGPFLTPCTFLLALVMVNSQFCKKYPVTIDRT